VTLTSSFIPLQSRSTLYWTLLTRNSMTEKLAEEVIWNTFEVRGEYLLQYFLKIG